MINGVEPSELALITSISACITEDRNLNWIK